MLPGATTFYRLLLVLSATAVILSGLASWSRPYDYNPFLPRVLISGVGILLALAPTSLLQAHFHRLSWYWGLLVTAWFHWVAYRHALTIDDVVGLLPIVTVTAMFCRSRVQVLATVALILGSLALIGTKETDIQPGLAALLLGVTATTVGLLSSANATLTTSLEQRVEQRTAELAATNASLQRQIAVRREAEHRAEAASAAKSRFLATMSHELRTPLNAIRGYTEIVEEDLEEGHLEDIPVDLGRIQTSADHLLGLIDQILDLTRIERGELDLDLQPVDPLPILERVVEGHAKGRTVTVEGRPGPAVQADPERLEQILAHLVDNALKFTGPADPVEICVEPAGGRTRIHVIDHGVGIPAEQLGRIFDRFSMVDASSTRRHGGIGLGLALAHDLAGMMGGALEVKSEVGVGSRFTLVLQAVDPTG